MTNYARIEARYYDVELWELPLRKILNLTYGWLIDLLGGSDEWDKHYAPIFDPSKQENDTVSIPKGMRVSSIESV